MYFEFAETADVTSRDMPQVRRLHNGLLVDDATRNIRTKMSNPPSEGPEKMALRMGTIENLNVARSGGDKRRQTAAQRTAMTSQVFRCDSSDRIRRIDVHSAESFHGDGRRVKTGRRFWPREGRCS